MSLVKLYSSQEIGKAEKGRLRTVYVGGNGIFEEQKSWLGSSIKKVNSFEIPSFPEVEEQVEIAQESFPRIPKEALLYVMKWYESIQNKNGEEAQINFYKVPNRQAKITVDGKERLIASIKGVKFWTDEIFSYTPKQVNSGAQTSIDGDNVYSELIHKIGMYVETHSHNSMSAFKSGTDAANSENDAVQLVFGKLNEDEIEMFSWITIRGYQHDGLTVEELSKFVELPDVSRFNEHTGKVYFSKKRIFEGTHFDNSLLKRWSEQITVKIIPKYTFYGTSGKSFYKTSKKTHSPFFNSLFDYKGTTSYREELEQVNRGYGYGNISGVYYGQNGYGANDTSEYEELFTEEGDFTLEDLEVEERLEEAGGKISEVIHELLSVPGVDEYEILKIQDIITKTFSTIIEKGDLQETVLELALAYASEK